MSGGSTPAREAVSTTASGWAAPKGSLAGLYAWKRWLSSSSVPESSLLSCAIEDACQGRMNGLPWGMSGGLQPCRAEWLLHLLHRAGRSCPGPRPGCRPGAQGCKLALGATADAFGLLQPGRSARWGCTPRERRCSGCQSCSLPAAGPARGDPHLLLGECAAAARRARALWVLACHPGGSLLATLLHLLRPARTGCGLCKPPKLGIMRRRAGSNAQAARGPMTGRLRARHLPQLLRRAGAHIQRLRLRHAPAWVPRRDPAIGQAPCKVLRPLPGWAVHPPALRGVGDAVHLLCLLAGEATISLQQAAAGALQADAQTRAGATAQPTPAAGTGLRLCHHVPATAAQVLGPCRWLCAWDLPGCLRGRSPCGQPPQRRRQRASAPRACL